MKKSFWKDCDCLLVSSREGLYDNMKAIFSAIYAGAGAIIDYS